MQDVEVITGDALTVLRGMADGSVDAVVTDPPYGINGGRGGDSKDYRKGAYAATDWQDTEEYIADVVVPAIRECIRVAKRVAVTPGIRCLHLYPRAADVGCFWTPASVTHGPWGFTTFQPILYYGRDWRAGRGAWPSGKSMTERAEKNGHPCPKPLLSWKWLVEKMSQPGETVLDPFAGSFTTAVACIHTGRKFIGIERETAYVEIGRRRIAETEPALFMEAVA